MRPQRIPGRGRSTSSPGERTKKLTDFVMRCAILSCVIVGACARGGENAPNSARDSAAAPMVAVRSIAAALDTTGLACPHTGRWAMCNVEQRLRQAGFVARAEKGPAPSRPGFSVSPAVYSLGRSRLEVFIYSDEAALARDMVQLDTMRVAPAGVASPWDGTPQLIRSGNLAAVYIGDNPRQAERLMLALTAGAPQPGSPR